MKKTFIYISILVAIMSLMFWFFHLFPSSLYKGAIEEIFNPLSHEFGIFVANKEKGSLENFSPLRP